MKKASKALSVALALAAIVVCLASVPLTDGEDVLAQTGDTADVDPLVSTDEQVSVSTYDELVTSLDAATGGETVILAQDITVPNNTAIQIKDKENAGNPITIDFNGNIVYGSNENTSTSYNDNASAATGVFWIGGSHVVLTDTAPADESGSKGGIMNSVVSTNSVNTLFVCASKTITTGLQVDGNVSIGMISNTDQTGSENYNTKARALNVYGTFTVADVTITLNEATVTSVGTVLVSSNKSNFDITINGGYYGVLNGQTMDQNAITTNDCLTIYGGNFINCKLVEQHGDQIRNHVVVSPIEGTDNVLETVQLYGPESYSVAIFAPKGMPNSIAYLSETITDISPYMNLLVSGSQITVNSQVTIDGEFGVDQGVPERLELYISDGASVTGNIRLKTATVSMNQGTILPDGFLTPYDSSFSITRDDTIWVDHTVYKCEITDAPLVVRTGEGTYKFTSIVSALAISGQYNRIDITLLDDIESGRATISNGVGIDLNGHTWTLTDSILVNEGSSLVLSNSAVGTPSTVQLPTGSDYSLGISGGSVYIYEDVTVQGNTVLLQGAEGGSLDVYGTIDTTGTKNTPIMGNGAEGSGDTRIDIYETAAIKSDVAAIYHPQSGTITIHGGTITGSDGIYIKAGTLDMRGGTVSATGPAAEYTHNPNGYVTNGNAITIEACGYPGGAPSVTITGGTVTSANNQSVAYYVYEGSEGMANTKFITGGTFSSDVSEFMDDNRGCYPGEGGMWVTDDAYILTFHSDTVVTIKVRHDYIAEGVPELTPGEGYSASWVSEDGHVFDESEPVHSSYEFYAVYIIEDVNVTIDQVGITADGVTLEASVTSVVSIDDSKTTYSWVYEGSEIGSGAQITVSEPGTYRVDVVVYDSDGNSGTNSGYYDLEEANTVIIEYPDYLGWESDVLRVESDGYLFIDQIEVPDGYEITGFTDWDVSQTVVQDITVHASVSLTVPEVSFTIEDSGEGYAIFDITATHPIGDATILYLVWNGDVENPGTPVDQSVIHISETGTYSVHVYVYLNEETMLDLYSEWHDTNTTHIVIPEAPENPAYSVSTSSIVAGPGLEMKLQTGDVWSDDWVLSYEDLEPNVKYTVKFRVAATDENYAGHEGTPVQVSTEAVTSAEQDAVPPSEGEGFSAVFSPDEATLSALEGYQLSYDGVSTSMADLVIGPGETFYVRAEATTTMNASEWVPNTMDARPETPTDVEIVCTATKISVSDARIEFRIDNGDWMTGTVSGLEPETEYVVEYRLIKTDKFAGETVEKLVKTSALTVPDAPETGIGYNTTFSDDNVLITPDEGYEISEDGAILVGSITIGPGESFMVRVAAGDDHTSSVWTNVTMPERPQAPGNPNITAGRTSISVSDAGIEIRIEGGEWGTTITGLSSGTSYTVQYRLAATETSFAGIVGEVTVSTTSSSGGGGGGGGTTPTPDPEPEEDTETVTNPDGSSTTTTTRPDGSSTVTTERPDGSSTTTDTKPVTGGTQTTVTETDTDGNTTSTTTTETETTTSTGSTVTSTTVEKTDADGNTTSTTESTYTSEDESTVTQVTVTTDADGNRTAQTNTTVTVAPSDEGTATVPTDAIAEAVNQIGDATSDVQEAEKVITVQPSGDTTQNVQVVIEPEAIRHVADAGAQLEIAGDVGTIKASTDVATSLSQRESPVSMSISLADKTQMAPVIQSIVGDRPTYQLTASSGEDSIHELGGDVTVTIPYTLSEGEDPESIVVFYVDDDGILHAMPTSYENGVVSFTTNHFSYYTIQSEIAAPEPETSDDGGDNTLYYVAAAVIAIVVIAAIAVFMRHKV